MMERSPCRFSMDPRCPKIHESVSVLFEDSFSQKIIGSTSTSYVCFLRQSAMKNFVCTRFLFGFYIPFSAQTTPEPKKKNLRINESTAGFERTKPSFGLSGWCTSMEMFLAVNLSMSPVVAPQNTPTNKRSHFGGPES